MRFYFHIYWSHIGPMRHRCVRFLFVVQIWLSAFGMTWHVFVSIHWFTTWLMLCPLKPYVHLGMRLNSFEPWSCLPVWWGQPLQNMLLTHVELNWVDGNAPVTGDSPHKGQWCRALMFSLICAWTNSRANNQNAGDLGWHHDRYDVTVMMNLVLTIYSRNTIRSIFEVSYFTRSSLAILMMPDQNSLF